jgi:hypothetical protein
MAVKVPSPFLRTHWVSTGLAQKPENLFSNVDGPAFQLE